MHAPEYKICRAKYIIPLVQEKQALGQKALDAPLAVYDDAVLVTRGGIVEAVESYASYRRSGRRGAFIDLGDVCLAPGLINAHCHLELSSLAGKTLSGHGFAAWMRSLVAALHEPLHKDGQAVGDDAARAEACAKALCDMADAGVAHVGDVGSRFTRMVHLAGLALARERDMPYPLTHFLEVLGFMPESGPEPGAQALPEAIAAGGYTPACVGDLPEDVYRHCAVSGHALYSTAPEGLRAALDWCERHERPFSLHLAESEEEEQCLEYGRGALHALLAPVMLPRGWAAPGQRAVAYAERLGLLTPRTMAVHCVQCSDTDIERIARAGASVCLCPRSNAYIGVGRAPAGKMARAGIRLCLGTDGLSSNHDLDLRRDVEALCADHDFSPQAALRVATVNGAAVFGRLNLGALEPGKAACFSLWEADRFRG